MSAEWPTVSWLTRRKGWTAREREKVDNFIAERRFEVAYLLSGDSVVTGRMRKGKGKKERISLLPPETEDLPSRDV